MIFRKDTMRLKKALMGIGGVKMKIRKISIRMLMVILPVIIVSMGILTVTSGSTSKKLIENQVKILMIKQLLNLQMFYLSLSCK